MVILRKLETLENGDVHMVLLKGPDVLHLDEIAHLFASDWESFAEILRDEYGRAGVTLICEPPVSPSQ